MTEGRLPEPEPEPEHPNLIPDGRDPRPENDDPSILPGFRSPFESGISLTANRLPLTASTFHFPSLFPRQGLKKTLSRLRFTVP